MEKVSSRELFFIFAIELTYNFGKIIQVLISSVDIFLSCQEL